jgi:glutathione synthase/RimK-type ligase-like ATP-grasp enzyme
MKTILLITARFDASADLLLAELRRHNAPCVRWNTREFPQDSVLTYRLSNGAFGAEIISDGRRIDLETIGSIWWGWDQPNGFPGDLIGEERGFAEREAQLALTALMTVGNFLWINHPLRERRAKSKPAQLFVARQVGFEIPQTVITNDPDEAREFIEKSSTQIVYKGLSQPRNMKPGTVLFTNLLTNDKLAKLDLIRLTPGIFQERVEKAYEIRITVVGTRIFGARIDSQAQAAATLDWRRALQDVNYEAIDLPPEIETKIHAFMDAFGLVYGAFDFIVTPDGRYVFLEVNPSGQYMWVECATGLGITSALAEALSEPCRI